MTAPAAPTRPRPIAPLLALALPGACLLWAFWPTLIELTQTWNSNPQYSHGFLVPVFAGILLWLRRDKLVIEDFRPSLWGVGLLALAIGLRLLGTYFHFVSIEQASLVPCVAGLVLLVSGWAGWRWAWPAVLFLAFMIPLPHRVAVSMSEPLQRLATMTSTFVMQTLGLPALAEGNVILLEEHEIGIVEACSGLRMLVVFFALSTAMVLVVRRHWIDKTVIVASAVPIALVSNIFRVTATGMMYYAGYSEMASTFFHDVAGWLMMPLALGMLWVELKVLGVLLTDPPQAAPRSTRKTDAKRTQVAVPRPAVPRGRRTQTKKVNTHSEPTPQEAGLVPNSSEKPGA